MKVDRLEISGFKSFVDPVAVQFAGGITAIVGPNGCGKSNLSEAMTWVLGEQSAKSLRGGTMEDVIFNGTDGRKPLGMAEATLTLRTDRSFPHSEDGKIVLARRVFRGGESQYRLNGKIVRLKEIRDILMDTGLGLRAYSVIEQGKIGMILSGKPQERRKLLEEAAGITRYKARKGVAEVKLEEAVANLLRLDDVISEVERALRTLKRQAAAAKRFQEKEIEYRELLERTLLVHWAVLFARLEEIRSGLEATVSQEAEAAADLHRGEAELASGREHLDVLARHVAERHQRHAELSARIEGRQQFLRGSRETVREIGERAAQAGALATRRELDLSRHVEELATLSGRRAELVAERDQAASAVNADQEQIASAERELRQTVQRIESLRAELLGAVSVINAVRNRAQQAEIELEKGNYRRHHLDREIEEHDAELRQADENLTVTRERVGETENAAMERAADAERTAAMLETTVAREAAAAEAKRRLEGELSEARGRQRLLTELSRADAERRRNLVDALASVGLAEPSFLADHADPVAGWERCLDFYLGALSDAVVLAPDLDPLALASALAGRAGGQLIAPLARTDESAAPLPSIQDPAIALSVGEALGLDADLAAALPPAFLVRSADDARRLAARHAGTAFLTREGVWVEAGVFHIEGEIATPGVLERERDLAELARQIPDLEARLSVAIAELEGLVAERAALAKDVNRLQGEVSQLRQENAVARARFEDAQARARRLATERETLLSQRTTLSQEIERVGERGRLLSTELSEAESKHRSLQERFDAAQAGVELAKSARESLKTESAGRRGRLDLLIERLESHDRDAARLATEVDHGKRQIKGWLEESERLGARRSELEAQIAEAELDLQAALESRATAEEDVLSNQERLDEQRREIREREERIVLVRESRESLRAAIEELRVTQAGLQHDAEHLANTHREDFGRELPESPAPAEGNHETLEDELARVKATLERLGPVNLLALQEHDEQEERLQFLTVQRDDVTKSVESLRSTIREINQTSSQRFAETFTAVNQTFGEVFQRLFRGGEAEMRLMDEDDVLESGIEIVARPPGKRLQNLMLLSGGEKALTAIALLFALFRSKPSPFCILDEVDAPLDDVNTARFADLLRDMIAEGETQFIVITHNKLTMEAAGTLYGVTMEEKGVSKLVAVQLEEMHPAEQRATA